ncbi:hypothetical protein EDD86DRAFT_205775 [Gorgonomyces haynaldii]|nr:hypothetical protein EDD86DRAFT_205775 [Gorgonomyces haynaldii]
MMDKAREVRFRLPILYYLYKATTTGAPVDKLYESSLRLFKSKFLYFLQNEQPFSVKIKIQVTQYFESFIWWVSTLAVASGITTFLIVTQTTLSTVGTDTKYVNASVVTTSIPGTDYANPTCFKQNWATQAVTLARYNYVYGNISYMPLVYALGLSSIDERPMTIIGYGNGVPIWTIRGKEAWTDIPSAWTIGCNTTVCYAYVTAKPSTLSTVARTDVQNNFNQMASIDQTLVLLAQVGSVALDKWVDQKGQRMSVPYLTLVGSDTSTESDIYRAAYLLSRSCSVDSSGLKFQVLYGIQSTLSWFTWEERPVAILSSNTTVWYSKTGYIVVLIFVIISALLMYIPDVLLIRSWIKSPVALWWIVKTSFDDFGPERLSRFYEHPRHIVLEHDEYDCRIVFLYFNMETKQFILEEDGFDATHPGFERITWSYRDADMRKGKASYLLKEGSVLPITADSKF